MPQHDRRRYAVGRLVVYAAFQDRRGVRQVAEGQVKARGENINTTRAGDVGRVIVAALMVVVRGDESGCAAG